MSLNGLIDLVFPPTCLGCGRVIDGVPYFCGDCEPEVEALPDERCFRCSEPGDFAAGICPRCVVRPPPFTRAYAPLAHDGAVARAIHRFKYEDQPELTAPLTQLLVERTGAFLARAPQLICALPLHVRRYRERRYDQAQLLAGAVARSTGRKHLPTALERIRETQRQVGLSEEEREENVEGAFKAASEQVNGRAVLLIDDVFTTGATARAAAQALKDAGATEVQVLTVARAYTAP